MYLDPMASLAFLSMRIPLDGGRNLVIGRDRTCDISVPDPHISRRHAEIRLLHDGSAIVSDLGSVNGMFSCDEQVPFVVLRPGSEFLLGIVGFRFE